MSKRLVRRTNRAVKLTEDQAWERELELRAYVVQQGLATRIRNAVSQARRDWFRHLAHAVLRQRFNLSQNEAKKVLAAA